MRIFLTFLLGLILTGHKSLNAETVSEFSLIKRNEIYLYRPNLIERPFSKVFCARPLFLPLPDNKVFLVETGLRSKQISYLFADNGELKKMIINTQKKASNPRELSIIKNLFLNSDNRFGAYDFTKRLTLFGTNGDYSESIVLPLTINSALILFASMGNNTLAVAGLKSDSGSTYPMCGVLDVGDTTMEPLYFTLCEDEYAEVKNISPAASSAFFPNITILSENQFACNTSTCPEVRVFKKDGVMLTNDTTPSHFQSIMDAEPPDNTVPRYTNEGTINEVYEKWFSSWTYSYPPYAYTENKVVVPRVLYPDNYLDIYSYSEDVLSYLGFAHTDKRFLYADSTGAYLLESSDDTSIVVGVYDIVTSSYRKEGENLWATMKLSLDELSGIRKVKPDTSKPCGDCDKEKRKPRGYETKLNKIKLVSVDGVEYSLKDSLISESDHVVLFGGLQDCAMHYALMAAEKYVEENPNCDLTIVYTHEYAEELHKFVRLMRTQTDHLILTNTDKKKLASVLKASAEFLVIDNEGTIVASTVYPTFELKPREKK